MRSEKGGKKGEDEQRREGRNRGGTEEEQRERSERGGNMSYSRTRSEEGEMRRKQEKEPQLQTRAQDYEQLGVWRHTIATSHVD